MTFSSLEIDSLIKDAVAAFGAGNMDRARRILQKKGGAALRHPLGANIMASIHLRTGEARKALNLLMEAVRSAPRVADTHFQMGIALGELGRADDAVQAFDRAIERRPNYVEALVNRANPLMELGRVDEALQSLDAAGRIDPRFPELRSNRSMMKLLSGDLEGGWREWDSRWERLDRQSQRPKIDAPTWDGSDLDGRRLLVWAEQGLGDTIQFVRFLDDPRVRRADLTFLVPARLHRLLRRDFPHVDLIAHAGEGGRWDVQAALMSLPSILHIDLASIPANVPYLHAEADRIAFWHERLGDGGLKIGIGWQGNPGARVDKGRSVPLSAFEPLASVPGIRLISLQKYDGLEQIRPLRRRFGLEVLADPVDEDGDAFVDTAAIISRLDAVVTSDTALAHLAGALGARVFLAVKRIPDWRWFLDREDTPWYPDMTLVRQERANDWDDVMKRIAAMLAQGVRLPT